MSITDELHREDIAIERAAMALCWASRPVLLHSDTLNRHQWWDAQSGGERRLHLARARIAITEWEHAHA